ncbi:SDR family NAD(P)-dependent oxidoreductase [Wenyingzhuangia sp. IMCC45533]
MKNVVIIGGTSGIGKGLATKFLSQEYRVGVTGRRLNLLADIQKESNSQISILEHDITDLENSKHQLEVFFNQFKQVDIVVVAAGISELNEDFNIETENKVLHTNVNGVVQIYQLVFSWFKTQGFGHLVGISSIASIRGNRFCPAYSASKAFQANYLESLRFASVNNKLNIHITDIQPGFVNTAAAKGEGLFWVAPVPKVASQIYKAILKKKRKKYVTKRWGFIAWVMKVAPSWLMEKM